MISVDLPAFGRPTIATCSGLLRFLLVLRAAPPFGIGEERHQRLEQIRQALAVLGRERDRIAEAQREGLVGACEAGAALGLVGDEDHGLAGAAHHFGERPVGGQDADARIDDEEDDVGIADGGLGLRAHAAEERFLGGFFEAGRVDDAEFEVAETRLALAPVAGDAGLVVDERELLADQPVEQGRLADIRPPDDGDERRHVMCLLLGHLHRTARDQRSIDGKTLLQGRRAFRDRRRSGRTILPAKSISPVFRPDRPRSSRAEWRQGFVGTASRSSGGRTTDGSARVETQPGGA